MPISDITCVKSCYASEYGIDGQFDFIYNGEQTDDVWVGVNKFQDDDVLITFRGSINAGDWFRDFRASMETSPIVGPVEHGFYIGMVEVAEILWDTPGKVVLTGHSLGAARALIFGALLVAAGRPIDKIVTFGSPRPGGLQLKEMLAGVTLRSYKNRRDIVTEVPPVLPYMPYCHPSEFIQIDDATEVVNHFDILNDHHIENYVNAMLIREKSS